MAIPVKKNQGINLKKVAPTLKKVRVRLSWNPNPTTGAKFDLDITSFGLAPDANGASKMVGVDADFMCFYYNLVTIDGACKHSGDNRTGDSAPGEDDEHIVIELDKVDPRVREISIVATIDKYERRNQNFGQIPSAKLSIWNDDTDEEIVFTSLENEFSDDTAVQFGSFFRNEDNGWDFKAVKAGYKLGLERFVIGYGGEVAED